jgi:LacI family transcriptional regulator
MTRRVSMQSIADSLGLSKYAVSRALSGKTGVSEDTRRTVVGAARALGYQLPDHSPDLPVPSLDSGYVLVWMNPAFQSEPSYWGRVLAGIAAGCKYRGWEYAIVAPKSEGEQPFPVFMERSLCIGHIAVGQLSGETLVSLKKLGGPFILLDNEEPLIAADTVLNANMDGAVALTRHLLQAGRRSLLFVGSDDFAPSFRERWFGCKTAVERFGGREAGATLRKWSIPFSEARWSDSLHVRLHAMSAADRPDAFICANDIIALTLMKALQGAGMDIPKDCAVAGFDNIEASADAQPPLTTVELAKEMLGSRAVEQLARKSVERGAHPEKILLSARLVVRQSG